MRKIGFALLTALFILTGCGNNVKEIPELVEGDSTINAESADDEAINELSGKEESFINEYKTRNYGIRKYY